MRRECRSQNPSHCAFPHRKPAGTTSAAVTELAHDTPWSISRLPTPVPHPTCSSGVRWNHTQHHTPVCWGSHCGPIRWVIGVFVWCGCSLSLVTFTPPHTWHPHPSPPTYLTAGLGGCVCRSVDHRWHGSLMAGWQAGLVGAGSDGVRHAWGVCGSW